MKKVVITGGPYSGKTTTIEYFKDEGYTIIPEAAIMVIEELNEKFGSAEETRKWRSNPKNLIPFQELISKKQIELEAEITQNVNSKGFFFDRSVIDGIAYCKYRNIEPSEFILNAAKERNYDLIIILDTLTKFDERKNTGRVSNYNDSLKLRDLIEKTYNNFGYETFLIEEKSISERMYEIKEISELQ